MENVLALQQVLIDRGGKASEINQGVETIISLKPEGVGSSDTVRRKPGFPSHPYSKEFHSF